MMGIAGINGSALYKTLQQIASADFERFNAFRRP
jgi:hypothetical protein